MSALSPSEIQKLTGNLVEDYLAVEREVPRTILGIPRGGMSVAYLLAQEFERRRPSAPNIVVDSCPLAPDFWNRNHDNAALTYGTPILIVDDIVDTGATMEPYTKYRSVRHNVKTASFFWRASARVKPDYFANELAYAAYIDFPWDERSGSPEDAIVRVLQYLGMDANEPSLRETPRRFLSWLNEFRADQPEPEITSFDGITYDQVVLVRDVPFISLCEHHLLPFVGTAAVAYKPAHSVIGLSKLARIVEWRAKRLQVQERLTNEIMESVKVLSGSSDVAVVLKAEHSCMSMRGPRAQGHSTLTSALSGEFLNDVSMRQEFLSLAHVG